MVVRAPDGAGPRVARLGGARGPGGGAARRGRARAVDGRGVAVLAGLRLRQVSAQLCCVAGGFCRWLGRPLFSVPEAGHCRPRPTSVRRSRGPGPAGQGPAGLYEATAVQAPSSTGGRLRRRSKPSLVAAAAAFEGRPFRWDPSEATHVWFFRASRRRP